MNLKASNLLVGHRPEHALLGPLSHDWKAGGMHLVLGGNGSGKSSLLRTLVQALPALSGDVSMSDGSQELLPNERTAWTKSIAFVSSRPPQQVGLTVNEVWALSGDPDKVHSWHPDLLSLATFRLSELSDGQAQQVMVARAMLQSNRWLVLDEPTAFLDVQAQRRLWSMLGGHVARGGGVLLATHDLWGVERWSNAQSEDTLALSSMAMIRQGALHALPLRSSKEDLSELLAKGVNKPV